MCFDLRFFCYPNNRCCEGKFAEVKCCELAMLASGFVWTELSMNQWVFPELRAKSEGRNPKSERKPNSEGRNTARHGIEKSRAVASNRDFADSASNISCGSFTLLRLVPPGPHTAALRFEGPVGTLVYSKAAYAPNPHPPHSKTLARRC